MTAKACDTARDSQPDPRELWEQARELEHQARELRLHAISAALERAHGLVGAAARLLGLHRSHLRNLLDGGQYPGLRQLAANMRARAGYVTGRAPADLRVEGDD